MRVNNIDNLIYQTARAGSPVNPGFPPALSYLLVAQARHETGNYTSNFFKKYNNLFGYSYVPGGKYQSGKGTLADNGQPIAAYGDLKDSVYELIDWIYRRQKEGVFPADLSAIVTPDQYALLLKNAGYYGDTIKNYVRGLQRFFSNNPAVASGINSALLGVLLILMWVAFKNKKTR